MSRTWELSRDHSTIKRARILAEIAFANMSGAEYHSLVDAAAYKIAEALEKYEELDSFDDSRSED